jgi:hypothetical protein
VEDIDFKKKLPLRIRLIFFFHNWALLLRSCLHFRTLTWSYSYLGQIAQAALGLWKTWINMGSILRIYICLFCL